MARPVVLLALVLPAVVGGPLIADEDPGPEVWLKRAAGYAAKIQVPDGRAALLVSIGSGYLEAGLKDAAKPLLAEAAAYAKKCTGCYAKAERLADVALLQARAGDPLSAEKTFRAAREACDELAEETERIAALAYLAGQRAQAGDEMLARPLFGEALHAARQLPRKERAATLAELAVPLLLAGEEELASVALRIAGRHEATKDARLLRLRRHLERGHLRRASAYVDRFPHDPRTRLEVHCQLLTSCAREGKKVLAEQHARDAVAIARNLPVGDGRLEALLRIARTAAEIDEILSVTVLLADAVEAVAAEDDPSARVRGSLLVARAAHAADLEAATRNALTEAEHGAPDDRALRDVAATSADLGDDERADRLAKRIGDPELAAEALIALAEARMRTAPRGWALDAAHRAEEILADWRPESRPAVHGLLRRVAVVEATCGEPEDALALVERIAETSPFNAATACTYIARDL